MAGLLLLAGCGSADIRAEDAPYQLEEVETSGVTVFEHDRLLEYLHAGETSFWPWGETVYYSEALGRIDSERIVQLYAAFGYRGAKVTELRVEPFDQESVEDGDRPVQARLHITVDEGPPTVLEAVAFDWTGGRDASVAAGVPVAEVEKAGRLKLGAPFSVERFNNALVDYKLALQDRSYALAQVTQAARVDPEAHTANARFVFTPGPRCTIGDVTLEGLDQLPADLVRREIEGLSGRPYSPERLKRAELALFGMDLFRSVTAVHSETVGPDGRLDVVIHTQPVPEQSLKVGFGFGFEPTRWEERVSAIYTHRNLFGRLYRLDLKGKFGWAELPTPWNPNTHGPVFEVEPRFTKKGLLEKRLTWTLAPAFELGIEQGYQFYSPSGRLGVSRWFFGRTLAELEYRLVYFDFFNLASEFSSNRTELGRDFRDPYLLSLVEGTYSVFFTDNLLDPENGVVLSLRYAVAGGPFAGDFDFQRVVPEVRAYWMFTGSTQLVARVRLGRIGVYGSSPGTPIAEKFALGSADTVRGWGLRRLSPQIRDCPDDSCRGIAVGGDRMVLGNIELRQEVITDLFLAAFLDAGDVTDGVFTTAPADLHYTVGGGLRYASPVGRFRFDYGYRVVRPLGFPDEPSYAFHLALGESF